VTGSKYLLDTGTKKILVDAVRRLRQNAA